MKAFTALFFVVAISAAAQPYQVPQVPHKINFAGITLTIRDDARREIQKDVDALWQSPRHFNIKVERAKTYFPIIEKIFAEERVPDDFKFLVLQESALIADAVSVSNAVGFWQFKDFTALEMGLRVDDVIDERMNIASATRGAAKYIKKNNYQFNNWVYALQAYQMGAGGVMRSVGDVESGTKHMTITSATYWYVKKFLAHKVAFENAVSGKPQQPVSILENNGYKSVEEMAASLAVEPDQLLTFNKWIRKGTIPNDKRYTVLIPLPEEKLPPPTENHTVAKAINKQSSAASAANQTINLNGITAIKAQAGESMTTLAKRAGISLPAFMSYNDLQGFEKINTGSYYYTARKKNKGLQAQAIAKKGDDLWSISQQYGVSLKRLKKYNRTDNIALREGQPVWLASKMPKGLETVASNTASVTLEENFFAWGSQPKQDSVTLQGQVIPNTTENLEKAVQPNMEKTDLMPVSETVKPTKHIVSAGENLYAIGRQYDIAVQDLIKWNNLGTNLDLAPGQTLNLIESQTIAKPIMSEELIHEVKPSDTLYSIARQYNVTIKELMDWNSKKDFNLSPGEKLKIFKR